MKRRFLILIFLYAFAIGVAASSAFATDYYIATNGTSGGTGAIGSPWDLQTGLNKLTECAVGNTFYLRGGTYLGKFTSTLDGCVVRSYTGEWAKIDGYATTTLNGAINSSVTSITLTTSAGLIEGEIFVIDTETFQVADVVTGNTITVNRGWNGTTAASHSNGATVIHAGNQLQITGTSTTYRDFEILNSYPNRDFVDQCCGFYYTIRGAGISQSAGSGSRFVNLYVHDNGDGIFMGSGQNTHEVIGCLLINNGGHYFDTGEAREAGSGHNLYLENPSGTSKVYQNIALNPFNFNGQFYGVSAAYVGGDIQDNVFANAGSPLGALVSATFRNFNFIYGPNSVESPTANYTRNVSFQPYNATAGSTGIFGYGAGIDALTLTNSYFIGGPQMDWQDVDTMTGSGNKFFSPQNLQLNRTPPALGGGTWNSHTYYDSSGRNAFGNNGSALTFASWKSTTGFDASSTETASDMPDTVIVIPNTEETGRCHVVVMAPSAPSTINVNLSTCGLTNGQAYTIKNPFNWDGSTIVSGVYSSGSPTISLPLTGAATSVATPIGLAFTPATTCPDLCLGIVIPGTASSDGIRTTWKGNIRIRGVKF